MQIIAYIMIYYHHPKLKLDSGNAPFKNSRKQHASFFKGRVARKKHKTRPLVSSIPLPSSRKSAMMIKSWLIDKHVFLEERERGRATRIGLLPDRRKKREKNAVTRFSYMFLGAALIFLLILLVRRPVLRRRIMSKRGFRPALGSLH